MPRSCIAGSTEKLFDADECISDLEQHVASILYIIGLEPISIENLEIDEVIAELRKTFSLQNSGAGRNQAHSFIAQNYAVLLHKLQSLFFNFQLSKYGKSI